MSAFAAAADRVHHWLRSRPFFLRMTWFTRILLAAGFIPTGMVKLLGRRFTTVVSTDPIGAFFEAMFQTGLFWNFIGAVQVAAGVCLLVPRLAHLGAAVFLPVIVSILVIVVGLGFHGTPWVVALMLLAVLYLWAWDWDRFRGLFTTTDFAAEHRAPKLRLDPLERAGFVVFAISLLSVFLMTRGLLERGYGRIAILVGFVAGLFTLVRFLTTGRRLNPS